MNKEEIKLKKLKQDQKSKSKKKELLDAYIKNSNNVSEKINALKLKHEFYKSSFISVFKMLMKKK